MKEEKDTEVRDRGKWRNEIGKGNFKVGQSEERAYRVAKIPGMFSRPSPGLKRW